VTYVAVVGSGVATDELYEKAREVGRLIAERGATVICGGLSGVMEAAARGATEAGGMVIGILPDEDRRRQNGYLAYSGDVVIAVGGEYGTLSEIGLARKVGRPVVVLEGWDLGEHVSAASSPKEAIEAAFRLLGR
jgi:predicted Rossmann-fold nucleotide-binding protein